MAKAVLVVVDVVDMKQRIHFYGVHNVVVVTVVVAVVVVAAKECFGEDMGGCIGKLTGGLAG